MQKEPLNNAEDKSKIKPSPLLVFFRSQLSAFLATLIDFIIVILLTEVFYIWYVLSNAIGAFIGTVVSFTLGRYWVFSAQEKRMDVQAFRYALVSIGSLVLNTSGVYLITEGFQVNYVLSKVIVSLFVGIGFNFLLHKYFVFK